MSWTRIWAIVLRHLYLFPKSFDRLTDMLYWPIMDIVLWGFTTRWLQQQGGGGGVQNIALVVLTALVFWQVVWRTNYEVSVNLLEELWSANLVNMFATPLKPIEWVFALMTIGFLKMFVSVVVGVGAVWLLYSLNIFSIGWVMIPYIALLMFSGWFMGFLGASLIMLGGTRVQTIAWTMGFLFAPFSAVYYPLTVLPHWAQVVAHALPTTYVFEGMRRILLNGVFSWEYMLKSLVLSLIYLIVAICFFLWACEKSREKGYVRLQ